MSSAPTPAAIGRVTLIMGLAMVAGNFAYGPLDRLLGTRKGIILGGNLAVAACLLALAPAAGAGRWSAVALLAALGFFGASFPMVIAHGRAFLPPHLTGRGVTLLNLFGIGAAGLMQMLTGPPAGRHPARSAHRPLRRDLPVLRADPAGRPRRLRLLHRPHRLNALSPPRPVALRGAVRSQGENPMGYRVVVAGATGNVGREMLNILAEREFPVDEIAALASRKSLGTEISFGDKTVKTRDLDTFDFTGWDIALFAVGSEATKIYAPRAAAAGCVVIDNSSLYRYDPAIPLIVPEVNADAIFGYTNKMIIANPNCSTAQMVVALKPLHDRARIKRVVVSTYQSVSGAGQGRHRRAVGSDQGPLRPRSGSGAEEVPEADRLQRDPADRRLPG